MPGKPLKAFQTFYIDFGALEKVDQDEFMELFRDTEMREDDQKTYASFLRECAAGNSFLLMCDNCGEIVLDKLLLEQMQARFPHLALKAMVRGGNVLNDATAEDAFYVFRFMLTGCVFTIVRNMQVSDEEWEE